MRRAADLFVRWLCRVVMRVFFKQVEVVGAEHVPDGVPLILVGNHTNALIDPVLLIGYLPGQPRLLAKSTLWNNLALKPLLALGGAIPVYRRQDAVDTAKNEQMFARCHQELADGGTIALFPEGTSHNEPTLLPMKTGAARIVLEAEAAHGPLGVRIVPVGLIFEDRTRFRSRALIQVGEPIDASSYVDRYQADPQEAVRALTDRIAESLSDVTLNYSSWEEARLIERVVELFAHPDPDVPDSLPLSERAALRKAFIDGYRELTISDPQRVKRVYRSVRRYDRMLRVLDLRSAQIASRYPGALVALFVAKTFRLIILRLPLTLVGVLLNWLPYRIPGWVAARAADDPDEEATYKVFTGFFLFPAFWIAWSALGGWLFGWWAVPTLLVLAPVSGYTALRSRDQRDAFLDEARAWVILRTRRRLADELRKRRAAVYEEVSELVEDYRQSA